MVGVPAKGPQRSSSGRIALWGQAFAHSLHCVQPLKNCFSSIAPGGRKIGTAVGRDVFISSEGTGSIEMPAIVRFPRSSALGSVSSVLLATGYLRISGNSMRAFHNLPRSRSRRFSHRPFPLSFTPFTQYFPTQSRIERTQCRTNYHCQS